jgi:hypothetical protein
MPRPEGGGGRSDSTGLAVRLNVPYRRPLLRTCRRGKACTPPSPRPSPYPQSEDPLGQAAFTSAAMRGLAEAVAALQGSQGTAATESRKAS